MLNWYRYIHQTVDIYKDIAEDFEAWFDTWNYELEWPFPKEKHIQAIGLMKDKLSGITMTKLAGLRAKTYSY